ncbi:MAG: Fur family transcriptional regulator, partial [Sedimenticolaceae bacterium]
FLQEQGLIHKLESLHAFVGCNHPEHPHAGQFLICTDCGEVNEVCNHELDKSLNAVEKNQGFNLQRPVIELLGRCASCQK